MLKAGSTQDDTLREQVLIRKLRARGDWLTMMLHAGQISRGQDDQESRDVSAGFYRGFEGSLQCLS